jgi:hypothetical protein
MAYSDLVSLKLCSTGGQVQRDIIVQESITVYNLHKVIQFSLNARQTDDGIACKVGEGTQDGGFRNQTCDVSRNGDPCQQSRHMKHAIIIQVKELDAETATYSACNTSCAACMPAAAAVEAAGTTKHTQQLFICIQHTLNHYSYVLIICWSQFT